MILIIARLYCLNIVITCLPFHSTWNWCILIFKIMLFISRGNLNVCNWVHLITFQLAKEKVLQLRYVVAECLKEGALRWSEFLLESIVGQVASKGFFLSVLMRIWLRQHRGQGLVLTSFFENLSYLNLHSWLWSFCCLPSGSGSTG